jgi:ketosteroid isomerase-like protein
MTGRSSTHVHEIRDLLDGRAAATRKKDVDGALAHYAHEVVTFDVVEPLEHVGIESVRERIASWFATFDGPIGYDLHDVRIAADEHVGFASCLYKVSGTLQAGEELGMWVRATFGFHRIEGEWRITHEHDSVPFDPSTGQASLDLEP